MLCKGPQTQSFAHAASSHVLHPAISSHHLSVQPIQTMRAPLKPPPPPPHPIVQYGVDSGLCVAGKEVVVLTSNMVTRGSDAAVDSSDLLPAREMFVAIA